MIAFCYHDVADASAADTTGFPGASAATYKIAPARFREHLASLAAVPGLRAAHWSEAGSRPSVALTFDDGGSSARLIADMLDERCWVGHFFVTTNRIGNPAFLDAAGIRDLARRGHVIGSHSHTHTGRMCAKPFAAVREEWRISSDILSGILGTHIDSAAVPSGAYSWTVAKAAASVGIRALFTQEPIVRVNAVESCQVFGRFTLRRWTKGREVAALASASPWTRAHHWSVWALKQAPKSLTPKLYSRIRAACLPLVPARRGL